ncbi:WD40 repeat domain-containing protein [Thermorudis peleae]|uniref:WD40 repeat domain-containing protein n=1 Tax=Thermorudis peleae TaxID=1382356 RepID=UPI00057114FD|nr:PD40 domain-containing protein [Thermorudis peleae]
MRFGRRRLVVAVVVASLIVGGGVHAVMSRPVRSTPPNDLIPAGMAQDRPNRYEELDAGIAVVQSADLPDSDLSAVNATPLIRLSTTAHLPFAWSPDGLRFATGAPSPNGDGDGVRLWTRTGRLVAAVAGPGRGARLVGLSWSPDSWLVAAAYTTGVIQLWTADGHPWRTFMMPNPAAHLLAVAWSPNGSMLAAGAIAVPEPRFNMGGWLEIWRVDGQVLSTWETGKMADTVTFTLRWSRDGSVLVAGAGHDFLVWRTNQEPSCRIAPLGDTPVHAIDIAPNGQLAALGDDSGVLTLYELTHCTVVAERSLGIGMVSGIAFSPDGQWLAIRARSLTALLRLDRLHGPLQMLPMTGGITDPAWSPDGQFLAFDDSVWDVNNKTPVVTLQGCSGTARALAWSSDGRFLAWGGDGAICVWPIR